MPAGADERSTDLKEVLESIMVTGVSAINSAYQTSPGQQPVQKPAPAPSHSSIPQDTVTLSSTAKPGASGDVDHDGDSH